MASLSELKEANRLAEEKAAKPAEEEMEEEVTPEEEESTSEQEEQEEGSEQEESEEEAASDDWTKGEEDGGFVPDSTAASVRRAERRKWGAKVEKRDDKIAELERKIQSFESNQSVQQKQQSPNKPNRDNFDTDDAYLEALADHKVSLAKQDILSSQQRQETQSQMERESKAIEDEVDNHYTRGATLAEKAGITPEKYQSADLRVRQSVESMFPGAGDAVVDKMISLVGEGSERVFYNLGVNTTRLQQFKDALTADNTGLKAMAFLGNLNAKLSDPVKRHSSAPAPATDIKGDKSGAASEAALKEKWKKAQKAGDSQKSWDIRKEARKAGINVSSW